MFTSSLLLTTDREWTQLLEREGAGYSTLFFVSDQRLGPLYVDPLAEALLGKGVRVETHYLPEGEQEKSLEQAQGCWRLMAQAGCDRRTLVVGLGGGVVTDLAGYVASGYMRGVDFLAIPTSLVGMVDAAIGGKCGINLPEGKNLVGAFWPAKRVILNHSFLDSLPKRHFCAGLAEVIKTGILMGEEAFARMESALTSSEIDSSILYSCATYKAELVEQDPRDETGKRALLNLGHTFGHALEKITDYQEFLHGEAVSIGLVLACRLGERLGHTPSSFTQRVELLLSHVGLPTHTDYPAHLLIPAMRRDKKNVGSQITCIIAEAPGKVFAVQGVDEESIAWAINSSKVVA